MAKNATEELAAGLHTSIPKPWCFSCNHEHPWNMPANTFRCEDCGFGAWGARLAASHSLTHRKHSVVVVFHLMRPSL